MADPTDTGPAKSDDAEQFWFSQASRWRERTQDWRRIAVIASGVAVALLIACVVLVVYVLAMEARHG